MEFHDPLDPAGGARAAWVKYRAHQGEEQPPPLVLPPSLVAAAAELELDEAELFLGVELARALPPAQREKREVRDAFVGLIAALRLAMQGGSTRLALDTPASFDALQLGLDVRQLALALMAEPAAWHPVVSDGSVRAPLVVDDRWLQSHRMWSQERRLAGAIAERLKMDGVGPGDVPGPFEAPFVLSAQQEAAVRSAASGRLALISGGPGTGKTSIVVAILAALHRQGVGLSEVALAAPTGKAADRMRQSVLASLRSLPSFAAAVEGEEEMSIDARTLHRLLGYSAGRRAYRYHADNPLAARVVVVDECSMVDLAMFDRLLGALAPDARLVLLGDADQLPSVQSGAVFRELCATLSGHPALTRLTESYRMDRSDPQGSQVYTLAQQANAGRPLPSLAWRRAAKEVRFEGAEGLPETELSAFLEFWWQRVKPPEKLTRRRFGRTWTEADIETLDRAFAHMADAQLLALTRQGPTGTETLNGFFGRRLGALSPVARFSAPTLSTTSPFTFAWGEPVMVRRNDYDLALFNGDQGVVLSVDGKRAAVFRGEGLYRAFPLALVGNNLEPAWCMTVHKSQGSEYERVGLVLPNAETPLATRELIYTAVTRARRGAVVVGSEAVLSAALARRVERTCGLGAQIQSETPTG